MGCRCRRLGGGEGVPSPTQCQPLPPLPSIRPSIRPWMPTDSHPPSHPQILDADVLVGHNIGAGDLTTLMYRMQHHKV